MLEQSVEYSVRFGIAHIEGPSLLLRRHRSLLTSEIVADIAYFKLAAVLCFEQTALNYIAQLPQIARPVICLEAFDGLRRNGENIVSVSVAGWRQ